MPAESRTPFQTHSLSDGSGVSERPIFLLSFPYHGRDHHGVSVASATSISPPEGSRPERSEMADGGEKRPGRKHHSRTSRRNRNFRSRDRNPLHKPQNAWGLESSSAIPHIDKMGMSDGPEKSGSKRSSQQQSSQTSFGEIHWRPF